MKALRAILLILAFLQVAQAQTPPRICVTPPPGLVNWWPFDEAALPTAIAAQDIAGSVNNASAPFLLGPTPVAGMVSNALSFDGVNDFLEVKNDPEVNFVGACGALNDSFTIDVWVKPGSKAGLQVILDKRVIGATGCPVGYMLGIDAGRLIFQMADGAIAPCGLNVIDPNPLPLNQWSFIAVIVRRCEQNGGALYVNGGIVATFTPLPGSIENTANLRIGCSSRGREFLNGCLDELEFFKRALTKAELDAIYNAGGVGKCKPPNCIRFDCPARLTVTTCSNCAPVVYSVSATNPCCDKVAFTCFPPPGTLFHVGDTTVHCLASDACGSRAECSFTITVAPDPACCVPPAITAQPQDTVAPAGSGASLTVAASGTSPLSYTWYRDGFGSSVGAGATLNLQAVQQSDMGAYYAVVSNGCGIVTSLVAQVAVPPALAHDAAVSVEVPSAVLVGDNATYNISVGNMGTDVTPSLVLTGRWTSSVAIFVSSSGCALSTNGSNIDMICPVGNLPPGSSFGVTVTFQGTAQGTLGFTAGVSGASGDANLANNSVSRVTTFGTGPVILTDPSGFVTPPGASGSMTVAASGTAPLLYEWRLRGVAVSDAAPTLSFSEVHASDAGDYVVVVRNAWGSVTSAVATVLVTFPAQINAAVDPSNVLRITGSGGTDDLEIRLQAGDPTKLEVDNMAVAGTEFVFDVTSWNRLVVEVGNNDNRLIFNDANGMVVGLNKPIGIYSGGGSNLIVASSAGLNLTDLSNVVAAVSTAPNLAALAQALYSQADSNLMTGSLDLMKKSYTNLVLASQVFTNMANTNLLTCASNLFAQAKQLSQLASNYASEAQCKFGNNDAWLQYTCSDFTNCILTLVAQLEALANTAPSSDESNGPDPTNHVEIAVEDLINQIELIAEGHEAGAEFYESMMELLYVTGADNFYDAVLQNLEIPGEQLGEVTGPACEANAAAFELLAEQALEQSADQIELDADALSLMASNIEVIAEGIANQARAIETALENYTALADPPSPFIGHGLAASIPIGTNAGCDRDVNTSNNIVIVSGGLIIGTPLNDAITNYTTGVIIFGLGGDDLIFGSTNFNLIFGGKGNDEIHGLAGFDVLFGGQDDDCIFGDADIDVVFGGDGADNLHGGTNIDLVIGWTGNDKLYGDENLDIMLGWDGDDEMEGGDGIDLMLGNKDADTMYGNPGFTFTNNIPFICKFEIGNLMLGGPGDDKMYGSEGVDVMFGFDGADEMYSSNQFDVVFGNPGADKIFGDDGGPLFYIIPSPGVTNGIRLGNLIFGGPDNDEITGGKDIDLLFGGRQDDIIKGSYAYNWWTHTPFTTNCGPVDLRFDWDFIFGGLDNDNIDGGYAMDFLFGGRGNDTIDGNAQTFRLLLDPEMDFIFGGQEDDTLLGGDWSFFNFMFGGRGNDTMLGGQWGIMNLMFGSQDNDVMDGNGNLLNLMFAGRNDDKMWGGALLIDLMFGGQDRDEMHGRGGLLDLMFGNDEDDVMFGDDGILDLMFANRGNDEMHGGGGVLDLMFGNRGCDNMHGDGGALDLMFGNDDQDVMRGGNGIDIMFGNATEDEMHGDDGLDVMFGNSGNDIMHGGDSIDLVFGNSGSDRVYGDNGLDLLFGNTGDDRVYGGPDLDLIFGGTEADCIDGEGGVDIVFGGLGIDIVLGGGDMDVLFGGADGDYIYGGSGLNLMFGGAGTTSDTIYGGSGMDIMFGQNGDDFLDGGSAGTKDFLFGNRGDDNFAPRANGTFCFGNRNSDDFYINGPSGVKVFGGPGSDTYEVVSGGAIAFSASSGSVGFSLLQGMCAEIHGYKWLDVNGNGVRDPGEPGIVGVTITLDLGGNGSIDQTTLTMADDPATPHIDETGMYWFTHLGPGVYVVREIVPPGHKQTFPANNGGHTVSLGPIDLVENKDFGNRPCVEPPPGMVLWLPLDEPSGFWAYNKAGGLNGRHGGPPAVNNGYVGLSRCYGAGQITEVLSHGLVNVHTNDFSLDCWLRRKQNTANGLEIIVDKRARVGNSTFGYSLFLNNGRLWCQLADGTFSDFDSGIAVPNDNQWHFIALTVQRRLINGGRFYVDGATSTFDPTARSGSLNNTGPFRVAGSPLLPGQDTSPGCLDEIEMFNRALSPSEVQSIYDAKQVGKCKVACHLPAVATYCGNQQTVTVQMQICNYNATSDTFTYSFAGLPIGPGCNVAGPTTFSPASGTVFVAAGACVTVPVTITRPVGMTGPTAQIACYQLTFTGLESGESGRCAARLSRPPNGLCIKHPIPTGLAVARVFITAGGDRINGGKKSVSFPVEFSDSSGIGWDLPLRISSVAGESGESAGAVGLNGLPPGQPVRLQLQVPPQGTMILDVLAEFVHDDPYRLYTILIEADLDGDGEFEPLFSQAVQEVVQGQIDIEQVAEAGLGPQAVVSWSGIGTLEFTPFPGSPWNDVPGFPGPPYIVPMAGPGPGAAPMQFFRLRQ